MLRETLFGLLQLGEGELSLFERLFVSCELVGVLSWRFESVINYSLSKDAYEPTRPFVNVRLTIDWTTRSMQ